MKKLYIFITAVLISSTIFGQTVLNQYSNIPNIEKLEVSIIPSGKEYILFTSADTLYKSIYDVPNTTLDNYNGIFTNTVTDIKNYGMDFAVSSISDFKVFNMFDSINASLISTEIYNSLAFSSSSIIAVNTNGLDNVANDIDKANYALWNPNTSGFSQLETSPSWKAQMLDDDGSDYYYVTKSRSFYSSGQTLIGGLNSVNSFYQTIHSNNALVDFGKFTNSNNDVLFYCIYDNNQGFIFNTTTVNIDITFTNTNTEVTSITYNDNDSMVYFSKPNDDKVYQIDLSIGSLFIPAYTITGMTNATDIEFDSDGNIWVAGNNGVFSSVIIPASEMVNDANRNGVATGIDKNETLTDINLYPNPSNQYLNVNNVEKNSPYKIYNQLGVLVLNGKTDQQINIESLTNGIYFLSIEGSSVQKFVKQ